ncbi:hypothetical protein C8F04DRAFT_1257317 [Mycena alexandri]|uniref:Uncharacterized protein n=1 Tax=Mycena alexandri TaxID=1745969 RepID=A0AAD6X6U0_9AGAR|nr:hypothetical protein C8F04DRAFT_1257317 [Mycena alexandri]
MPALILPSFRAGIVMSLAGIQSSLPTPAPGAVTPSSLPSLLDSPTPSPGRISLSPPPAPLESPVQVLVLPQLPPILIGASTLRVPAATPEDLEGDAHKRKHASSDEQDEEIERNSGRQRKRKSVGTAKQTEGTAVPARRSSRHSGETASAPRETVASKADQTGEKPKQKSDEGYDDE